MSSFHATSININTKAGTAHLTGYDSNVFPKKASRFESTYLSDMLKEKGQEAVDSYLLEQYQGGMVKGGNNDYNNTLALYTDATMENLAKLRQLKKDMRGAKFVIKTHIGYVVSMTTRRYRSSPSMDNAMKLDIITAMIKAKRITGAEVILA